MEYTLSRSVQGPHVENVNALHFTDEFETLETGGLVDVRGDSSGLGTGGHQVFFGFDFCDIR